MPATSYSTEWLLPTDSVSTSGPGACYPYASDLRGAMLVAESYVEMTLDQYYTLFVRAKEWSVSASISCSGPGNLMLQNTIVGPPYHPTDGSSLPISGSISITATNVRTFNSSYATARPYEPLKSLASLGRGNSSGTTWTDTKTSLGFGFNYSVYRTFWPLPAAVNTVTRSFGGATVTCSGSVSAPDYYYTGSISATHYDANVRFRGGISIGNTVVFTGSGTVYVSAEAYGEVGLRQSLGVDYDYIDQGSWKSVPGLGGGAISVPHGSIGLGSIYNGATGSASLTITPTDFWF